MATEAQRNSLRNDTAFPAMTDPVADEIITEAETLYSALTASYAAARVIVYQRLSANAAFYTSYTANATREELGKIHENMLKQWDRWEKKLTDALAAAATPPVESSGPRSVSIPITSVW